jgi:hypothetical protein
LGIGDPGSGKNLSWIQYSDPGIKKAPDPGSATLGERCEGLTFDFFAGSPHQGREGGVLRVQDPVPSQTKPNIKNSFSSGQKHLCNMCWFHMYEQVCILRLTKSSILKCNKGRENPQHFSLIKKIKHKKPKQFREKLGQDLKVKFSMK